VKLTNRRPGAASGGGSTGNENMGASAIGITRPPRGERPGYSLLARER